MASLNDREHFERWLKGKPTSWAQILACRAALRVVPLARSDARDTLMTFRAVGISFAARNIPAMDMRLAARAAADAAYAYSADAYAGAVYADAAYAAFADADADVFAADAADAAAAAAASAADAAADAAYAAAADDDTIWSSVEVDASWLENADEPGNAAEAMTALPLWPSGRPDWFDLEWQFAKRDLAGDGNVSDPWIDWFDRRIAGHATAFALPRAADEAIQIRIADQDDAFWDRGSAAVNADIQAWIDAAASPDIPPQRPHELITAVRDGRVALVHARPVPTTPDQDQRRRDAWQAIRDALDDYRADGPADNHPRLNRMIDRLAASLGAEFDALNPVGLGMQAQYLQQYAARADDFLVADRAADLVGLNVTVGSLLPQFKEWRDYLADSETESDVPTEALNAATAIVAAIAEQDVAEPEVNAALAEMAADAKDEASVTDPDEPKLQTYRQRLLGGLGNTLASASEIALRVVKGGLGTAGTLAVKGVKAAAGRAGKGVGNAIEKGSEAATLMLFGLAGEQLLLLAGMVPSLSWIATVVAYLKKNAPKDPPEE